AQASQADGCSNVDVLGKAKRAFSSRAAEKLFRLAQSICFLSLEQCPRWLACRVRHLLEATNSGGGNGVERADGAGSNHCAAAAFSSGSPELLLELWMRKCSDR